MHHCGGSKPLIIDLMSKGVTQSFQGWNELVFKADIGIEILVRIQDRDQSFDNSAVVFSLYIGKTFFRNVEA